MKVKTILALVVILAILGLIFLTDSGKKVVKFLTEKISETASFILGPKTTKTFRMSLEVSLENKKGFYEKSFLMKGSNFTASTVYNFISVDGGIEKVSNRRVQVEIKGLNGRLEITALGTLRVSGEANYIRVGDYERSREKPYQIEIEALPFDCSPSCTLKADNLSADLNFLVISGEAKKLRDDGSVDQIKYLKEESLTIQGFVGSFELAQSLILSGNAIQVKGSDFLYTG
ncbi:MAG: hypothetical protein QW412_02950 [Candidatus Aenigmatarchaeota archaeon]